MSLDGTNACSSANVLAGTRSRDSRFCQLDRAWSSTVPFRIQLWRCLQMRKTPRGYSWQPEFTPLVSRIQSQGGRHQKGERQEKSGRHTLPIKKPPRCRGCTGGCFQCGRKSTRMVKSIFFFFYLASLPRSAAPSAFFLRAPDCKSYERFVSLYRLLPV